MDRKDEKETKFMAKPIEATPILRGQDLVNFTKSLEKSDSRKSAEKRKSALILLRKISK